MSRHTSIAILSFTWTLVIAEAQSLPSNLIWPSPAPVPSEYQDIYNSMNTQIQNFNASLSPGWIPFTSPVLHSGQLSTANSDLADSLLAPNYYQYTVLSQLAGLQALGAQAITFHVNFPALYQPFYTNPADYQNYLAFYQHLMADLRSRGLTVIVENIVAKAYPGTDVGAFQAYYETLDWDQYQTQRAQNAVAIAQLLQPDYLVVVAEPDTEVASTGQPNAGTVSGSTQLVQAVLDAFDGVGVTGVQIGAGCGTWDGSFIQFIQSFSSLPLDFIDMHVYPVNLDFLPNAVSAAGIVQAAGKQATISEMWPYKVADDELGNTSYTTIFSRDAFSFWEPIDQEFLWTMRRFANQYNFIFTTPFWTENFGAYLDYGAYGSLPEATIITDEEAAGGTAFQSGTFTPTGITFKYTNIPFPDSFPPVVPQPPIIGTYSQTAVNLTWLPTTDNVGVAAYTLFRNGAQIAQVNSPLSYSDQDLEPSTTYTYTISAVDATGNESNQSQPASVTTYPYPDTQPPSTPTALTALAVSDVLVNLGWNPSTDNVGVVGYAVYRGTSPASLVMWALSSTTNYADPLVAPSTTYYYSVAAYDAFYNFSPQTTPVAVTSFDDTTPPSTPTGLRGDTSSGQVVLSWNASTDDYFVANYKILRGPSADNMWVVGATTFVNYTDLQAQSGNTYYYSIEAADVARNTSAPSNTIVVTAP